MLRQLVAAALGLAAVAAPLAAQRDTVLVRGVVRDSLSGDPIPFTIVRIAESEVTALSGQDGRYRLPLPPGVWTLEFRKIGYRMASRWVTADRDAALDVALSPVPVRLEALEVTGAYENPALRLIRGAIARKNDLLARIRDYRYDAYVKLVIRDMGQPEDSAASIFAITETETTAYWERPGTYQEVITARRQSKNVQAEFNLTSVGEIVNFNKDRIDIGKYAVVSPTADDALRHYEYQIVDTLWVGGQMVYRLAIEPRSAATPLFAGFIDIADSTFDVRAVDVGTNDAVRFEFLSNLRYRQRLEPVADDAWMPVEIRLAGEIRIGVPIPGVPNHLSFLHRALLNNFRFDQGNAPRTAGEYLVVVDARADDRDSTYWEGRRAIPLSVLERSAWTRIDSIEQAPASWGARLADAGVGALALTANPDVFHFNRVEGAYLGVGGTLRDLSPDVILRARVGRAFGRDAWQGQAGGQYRLSDRRRLWVGATYVDDVVARPTVVSQDRNATYGALFGKDDPLDYYHERGVVVMARTRLVNFVQLQLQYHDLEQTSLGVVTDYSFFDRDEVVRPNPPIVDGRLRSLSAVLAYDSRPLLRQKGRDYRFNRFTYTRVTVGVEVADPEVIGNDFDFVRYGVRFFRRQRTFNLGLTELTAVVGAASGDVPPQRYYTVDFGNTVFFQDQGFNTLGGTNFSGNRVAMVFVHHDFDRQLFRRSRIPLVRDLPFTVSVHGGVFWTEFRAHRANPGDELVRVADAPYAEVGFGVGNLTPWLTPLNLAAWFTWQVSGYDTERFAFRVGVPGL